MRIHSLLIIAITVAGFTTGNSAFGQSVKPGAVKSSPKASPQTVVYKTRKNYSNYVPVTLSADKSTIVSYPDPKTIKAYNKHYPVPGKLKKGYLLDNRGIGLNTAYLKITYAAYAKLSKALPLDTMMKLMVDKNPMTTLYNCGSRYNYAHVAKDIDSIIEHNKLKEACKQVK